MILTCKQLVERVTDARERRLSAFDRAGYRAHLAWCRDCRRFVRQLDQTVAALGALPPESPPPGLLRDVLARRPR